MKNLLHQEHDMAVTALTKDNFDTIISDHDLVVVDFTADWCEPCQAFSEVYGAMAQDFPDALFAQINVGHEPELANDFNVRSVPMIMILRHQVAVFMQSGVMSTTDLKRLINDAKALSQEDIRMHIDQSLNDSI
jgi:thioredoxin 1